MYAAGRAPLTTKNVYALATLGESPSVLSELLWWILVSQRLPLAGIEVWTTEGGCGLLDAAVRSSVWDELQALTGVLPAYEGRTLEPSSSFGFRVHVFEHDRCPLVDVRSQHEASIVGARLHDRVRDLRRDLPQHTAIVGSLAGGRKTVSAALQTAFCLQAGKWDRLVHILQHDQLERTLITERKRQDYWFPTVAWEQLSGIPCDQQIEVYDVPFPRVRWLVPRRISEVLDALDFTEVWPILDANLGRVATAHLQRTGYESWRYTLHDRDSNTPIKAFTLKGRAGALLAAMASIGLEDPQATDLVRWLDTHDVGWVPKYPNLGLEKRVGSIRQAANKLRQCLEAIPVGLERFAPPEKGFALPGVDVDLEYLRP